MFRQQIAPNIDGDAAPLSFCLAPPLVSRLTPTLTVAQHHHQYVLYFEICFLPILSTLSNFRAGFVNSYPLLSLRPITAIKVWVELAGSSFSLS